MIPQIAKMICKIVYKYFIHIKGFFEVVGEREADNLLVWLFRPVEAYKLNEIPTQLKLDSQCQLITSFQVDTGCHYEVISEQMK